MNALYHRIENQRLTIEQFQHSEHGAHEPVLFMDRHRNTITPEEQAECARMRLDRSGYSVPLYTRPQPASEPEYDRALIADKRDADVVRFLRNGGWEVLQDPKYWEQERTLYEAVAAARADIGADAAIAAQRETK